ncbi:hypothetical protein HRM2_34520 [Desulforapulum autotrophicum HRM2]|uniref:Transposase n=1 Tax=Desulforapulum autotrophicum (strain ATCC 43914 / DSM 3382 / VKM B-1955 / HRM2) TaxID=177437 RepID=C0Q922_DESAH|nr:hypothetical protein HRM2_34520 [Desulforapulum autotrophicum HRM2]
MERKNYSKQLKSRVAYTAIKGNQTVNKIAPEFGIHTGLVNRGVIAHLGKKSHRNF